MSDEKSIAGRDLKSRDYNVVDHYELVDEGHPTLEIEYTNIMSDGYPKLDSASFKLIRSFGFSNKASAEKIELKNLLVEGRFQVSLDPNAALRPTGYIGDVMPDQDARRCLFSASRFKLTDLYTLPLPTVTINGKFKHLGSERLYEITIEKAFITQDLPGSFFRRPLKEGTYTFVATDAIITPTSSG